MKRSLIALSFVLFAFLPLPTAAQQPGNAVLQVEVIGLRSNNGEVACAITASADADDYPRDKRHTAKTVRAPIHDRKAMCEFSNLRPDKYAVTVYHDENDNGKFDENAFGMPLEGYGFSNDAPAVFRAPNFKDAAFDYDADHHYITIKMRY